MKLRNIQHGFTIVELMIAITVLSTVLLIVTIGITRIGQTYYRGIAQTNTQQAARSILDDVSQSIQFSGFTSVNVDSSSVGVSGQPFPVKALCIGKQRYSYVLDYQQTDTTSDVPTKQSLHGLWRDVINIPSNCKALNLAQNIPTTIPPAIDPGLDGREMLGYKMRLTKFNVTGSGLPAGLFKIDVTVMYGDEDLIDVPPSGWESATCKPSNSFIGAAFCAKAELSTVVGKRLR